MQIYRVLAAYKAYNAKTQKLKGGRSCVKLLVSLNLTKSTKTQKLKGWTFALHTYSVLTSLQRLQYKDTKVEGWTIVLQTYSAFKSSLQYK